MKEAKKFKVRGNFHRPTLIHKDKKRELKKRGIKEEDSFDDYIICEKCYNLYKYNEIECPFCSEKR